MHYSDIKVGKTYGIRDKQHSQTDLPVFRVKVIDKLEDKKRSKVLYLDGERKGLEEFLPSRQFLGSWAEVRGILRDEARMEELREISKRDFNAVVWEAIEWIVEAMGDTTVVAMTNLGTPRLQVVATEAPRVQDRFGLDPLERSHPGAFVDREGYLNLPFTVAESVARTMAEREPQSVILYLQQHEEELLAHGYQPGRRTAHEMLREHQAAYALARQWAGGKVEAELLTREMDRLRRLVHEGIWMLKKAGADTEARRLERALDGR